MPVANQYGIDVANILTTKSALKTARMNQEKNKLAVDKEEAGRRNLLRQLQSKNVQSDDIIGTNTLSKVSQQDNTLATQATQPVQNVMSQEEMQDIALNPDIYNAEMEQASADALVERRTAANKTALRMSMPNATPAQIDTLATQKTANVKSLLDMAMKGGEEAKQNAIMHIDSQARILMTVTQAGNGMQNPELKQKAIQDAYTMARDEQMQMGTTPEERKEISDSIPALYNANWVAQQIAESKDIFDVLQKSLNAETKAKATVKAKEVEAANTLTQEELKQKGQLTQEELKQKNRIELEKLKQKTPKSGSKKEFMEIMEILENPNLKEEERRFYKARLTKLSQPDLRSKQVDINTANDLRGKFSIKLGLDTPYALATVDTRNLTPEQQAEANTIGQNLVKLSGANAKEVDKRMSNYGSQFAQTQNALTAYEKVGEFRLVDEKVKQYISNYTGLSKKEVESTEASQALQSLLNISIKADAGASVSAQEMVRKTLETASAGMTKQRIILGIKNLAKRNIGELNGLKKVMGQVPFNLRYGGVLRNYEDILDSTKNTDTPAKPKTLEELRAKSQRVIKRTGTDAQGNKVVQYEDGTIERAGQ